MKINFKICFLVVILLGGGSYLVKSVFAGKGGYIGSTYVEFPVDQYTFLVSIENDAGRRVVKDNLWGFRYPGFEPLTRYDRKEFMTLSPNWIRVSVENRVNSELCFGSVVDKYIDPARTPLARFIDKRSFIDGYDARDVMEVSLGRSYGLRVMQVPEKSYLKDVRIYRGPQVILWDEDSENKACTYIACVNMSPDSGEQYCTHRYVDVSSKMYYSINYSRKNLAGWKVIQDQSKKIFKGFEGR